MLTRYQPTQAVDLPSSPIKNHLLAALPDADYQRLLPDLKLVSLSLGSSLYEGKGGHSYVYFPTTAIVSVCAFMQNGLSTEIAVIGNEGLVGLSFVLDEEITTSCELVQTAGEGYRLKTHILRREITQGGEIYRLGLRFAQALMTQMAQTAGCNRYHSLLQQLCRWLLLNLDRVCADELVITHERIASALGVRRESVSEAASKLQAEAIIECYRGRIKVVDRHKLEQGACECYAVVKKQLERVLPYTKSDFPYPRLALVNELDEHTVALE